MNKVKTVSFFLYGLVFFLLITPWLRWAYFFLGLLVGLSLLLADEKWGYKLYLADELKELEADQKEVMRFSQLITRSPMFVLSLVPIGLFVVTSAGSFLAEGVYLGLVLGLMVEMLQLRSMPAIFSQRFLSNLKPGVNQTNLAHQIVAASLLFFLVINLLLIF